MKISFTTILGNSESEIGIGLAGLNSSMPIDDAKKRLLTSTGFGYASIHIIESLENLGHEVVYGADAPIAISWGHPEHWIWPADSYKIGFLAWESTIIPDRWNDGLEEADEIWAPSPIVLEWLKNAKIDKPMRIYEHGIEPIWTRKLRKTENGILKFLHHGEPASRKGGEIALKAFRAAFGDRTDVRLTMKAHKTSNIRVKDRSGCILGKADFYRNVSLIKEELPIEALVRLYHRNQVMVYPSAGEGFGFIPLQAMASGMPAICTSAWAGYADLLLPKLRLSSTLVDSPWPYEHPGKVFEPNFDELVDQYRYAADNFDTLAQQAYNRAPIVQQRYSWDQLTKKIFADLEKDL